MNVTVNQLRQEMTTLVQAHEMVNSFFWGDFHRAYNEQTPLYPLVCSYMTYNTMLDNMANDNLVIIICDKTYKDYSNLNDTESDCKQVARHLFNVIRHSPRWNALLRVNSATMSKFIDNTSDEVAGVILTLNVNLKSSRSLCDLPLDNYSFDGDFEGETCAPVLIVNSNQTFTFNASSGTIVELSDTPVTVTDQNQNELANVNLPSVTGGTIQVQIDPTSCAPVTYNVEYANGDPIESGSEPSGGHIEVIVPNPTCSDATAVLIDTATPTPNTISTTPISSGASANIVAPDGTVTVNRDGVFFATQAVRSNGTATVNVPSNSPMPNTGIYKSGQTILVLPSDAVRNLEGMGADWWNLDPATQNANIFGNYKRFTSAAGNYQNETNGLFYDKDGNVLANYAAAFPMGIVVDWSTRDWQYGKVLAYALNNVVAGIGDTRANLNTQFEALTIGSYANWKLPNLKELFNICHVGLANRTNYIPFNNSANLATNFWVRDSNDALTGSRINLGAGSNFVQTTVALNINNRGLAVSYLTISGTTLI